MRIFLLEAPNNFGWALQPILAVKQKCRGSWLWDSRKGAEDSGCSAVKATKKNQKMFLKKLERAKRIRGERFERFVYDPKTCWKVRGYFRLNEHACFLWHSPKIMYICGKLNFTICMYTIFPISMQKTVRPQIGPVKKKTPTWLCTLVNPPVLSPRQ